MTGSGCDSLAKQCGGWTIDWQGLGAGGLGVPASTTTGTTILAAIKNAVKAAGSSTTITTSADGSGAAGADRVVVVVGESPYAETAGDKADPTPTTADFATIAAVKAAGEGEARGGGRVGW